MTIWGDFIKGIWRENPTLVLLLGMCPTLALTSSAINGLSMGLATTFVLIGSNCVVSLVKNIVPNKIRIPVYIVIIASLVTIIQMLIQAFAPSLNDSLGVFIPLIVVNCIILGRAGAFASKNNVLDSAIDGLGMGLGYTLAVVVMSFLRELLATGGCTITNPFNVSQVLFSFSIIPEEYTISMFGSSVGAFVTFAILAAVVALMKNKEADRIALEEKEAKKKEMEAKKAAALEAKKGAKAV